MSSKNTKILSKSFLSSKTNSPFLGGPNFNSLVPQLISSKSKNTSFDTNESKNELFSQTYTISNEIGEGAFGKLYQVTPNDLPSQKFAAKITTRSNSHNRSDLKKEAQILNSLSFEEGFPRIQAFNIESKKEILIMSLLGQNLKTLHSKCRGKFSLKTVTLLAVQILKRLEALHSKGLLHRDIKPENVVMGSNRNDEGTAYLIDFGLSEPQRQACPLQQKPKNRWYFVLSECFWTSEH